MTDVSEPGQAGATSPLSFDSNDLARASLCRALSYLNLSRDTELVPYGEFRDSVGILLRELEKAGLILLGAPTGTRKPTTQ